MTIESVSGFDGQYLQYVATAEAGNSHKALMLVTFYPKELRAVAEYCIVTPNSREHGWSDERALPWDTALAVVNLDQYDIDEAVRKYDDYRSQPDYD